MLITDLMLNFQQALIELEPRWRRVTPQLKWHLGDATWDRLANATFRALVCDPIRESFAEEQRDLVKIPSYSNRGGDFTGWHFIEVVRAERRHAVCMFIGFKSTSGPFDTVEWRGVPKITSGPEASQSSGELCRLLSTEFTRYGSRPLDGLDFALRSPMGDRWDEGVASVAIPTYNIDGDTF